MVRFAFHSSIFLFILIILGGFLPSIAPEPFEYLSTELTPAESEPCNCFSCFKRRKRDRKKFTVRRMPGKVNHLVPMQRFDSNAVKEDHVTAQPSNHDSHHSSTCKTPLITTASVLEPKSSFDESIIQPGPNRTTTPALDTSTSISSLRICPMVPRYEPQNVQSQIDFQETLHLTSARMHIKRSSV